MASVLPDYLNDANKKVQSAGDNVANYAGREYTIGDELETILNDATKEGKTDWAGIRSNTLSDYLASPQQARAKYRDPQSENYIFNPAQSSRAMSEYTQQTEIPFLTANTLFGMFTKQEDDIINSGVNAFKAQQAAAQQAYEVAQQVYSNLLGEFQLSESVTSQREADKLAREQFDFQKSKANSGGSGDLIDTFDFISKLLSEQNSGGGGQPDLSVLDSLLEDDDMSSQGVSGGVYQPNTAGSSGALRGSSGMPAPASTTGPARTPVAFTDQQVNDYIKSLGKSSKTTPKQSLFNL